MLSLERQRANVRRSRIESAKRGFADVVFLPLSASGKPALVIELKYGGSAEAAISLPTDQVWKTASLLLEAAIEQIKRKQYTKALEGYTGEILLVGINYDKNSKDKKHNCVIEKLEKI